MGFKGNKVNSSPRHHHDHQQYYHLNQHSNSLSYAGTSSFNKGIMEQQLVTHEQTICFCHRFLNPLANYFGNGLVSPSLQHYCRVCNIQLNSCRQAKIHSEGKKHEKRLSYLRLCMESTGELPSSMPAPYQTALPPTTTPSLVSTSMSGQPSVHQSTHVPMNMPPPQLPSTTAAAMYTYQPAVTFTGTGGQPTIPPQTTTTFYYPQTTYQSVPPQQHSIYTTCYPEYMTTSMQPPQLPLQALQTMQPPPPVPTSSLMSIIPPPPVILQNSTFTGNGQQQQTHQHQHQNGVMSPSITSGFSGSGDCKSTETSSILSAASGSSVGGVPTVIQESQLSSKKTFSNYGVDCQDNYFGLVQHYSACISNGSVQASGSLSTGYSGTIMSQQHNLSSSSYCNVCQMAFPTPLVLENHIKGSRHARKLKSQQAFRQLKESGTHFRQDDGPIGEIRCEVCQVSVNSSQQLQAHLTGHKHKVRAVRRGVKPNQALLSPSSSTPSASSEHSFTANNPNNGKGGAKSGNKFVAPTPASGATETTSRQRRTSSGATLVRHQSSGCLSRHFQSTLSLSRTRSGSSALNKARSRSMNLLLVQADAGSTSSSSDDGYVDVDVDERQGSVSLKRRAYNLVNGRPRSLSVRTTSITKEDESRSRKELASSKLDPVSATARSQDDKTSEYCRRKQQNKVEQQMNKQNLGHNNNNSCNINQGMKASANKKTRSIASDWKPRRTSVGSALKDVPMLDVFLERLKPAFGKSTTNSNIKNKQHETKEDINP